MASSSVWGKKYTIFFPIHQKKPCQVDWQMLVFPVKFDSAEEKLSFLISNFDSTLLTASSDLKEFINSYTHNEEIFDLQERHDNMEVKLNTNKISFLINYIVDIFLFINVIISLLATTLKLYLLC